MWRVFWYISDKHNTVIWNRLLLNGLSYYAPDHREGGNKRCFCPSVRPSVSYIANNSRTQRLSMPKFGRKVPHLRCDSHTSYTVKESKVRVQGGWGIPCRPNLAPTLLVTTATVSTAVADYWHATESIATDEKKPEWTCVHVSTWGVCPAGSRCCRLLGSPWHCQISTTPSDHQPHAPTYTHTREHTAHGGPRNYSRLEYKGWPKSQASFLIAYISKMSKPIWMIYVN